MVLKTLKDRDRMHKPEQSEKLKAEIVPQPNAILPGFMHKPSATNIISAGH